MWYDRRILSHKISRHEFSILKLITWSEYFLKINIIWVFQFSFEFFAFTFRYFRIVEINYVLLLWNAMILLFQDHLFEACNDFYAIRSLLYKLFFLINKVFSFLKNFRSSFNVGVYVILNVGSSFWIWIKNRKMKWREKSDA